MKRTPTIHPFLFGVYPILFLYSINLEQVTVSEIILPVSLALGTVVLLLLFTRLVFGTLQKAGLVTSSFMLLFLSFGHIVGIPGGDHWFLDGIQPIWRHLTLLCSFFLIPLLLVVIFVARMSKPADLLTKWLNTTSVLLIVIILVPIVIDRMERYKDPALATKAHAISPADGTVIKQYDKPDIYYIILDGYGSEFALKKFYGYSNRKFLDALRARGFYIATESRSNYPYTLWSLSSSLNMKFVHLENLRKKRDEVRRLTELIRNPNVVRILRDEGYRYVHFGSVNFGPTAHNSIADVNIARPGFGEFLDILLRNSLLGPIAGVISANAYKDSILHVFEQVPEAPSSTNSEKPVFAFVHLMIPHPPYVFNRHGGIDSVVELVAKGSIKRKEHYVDEVIFANRKIIELVDRIKAAAKAISRPAPVIVIQGDHGPRPQWRGAGTQFDGRQPLEIERYIEERLGIVNAYHVPADAGRLLYESITPVNTFRVIFNALFGAKLELLEDVSYIQDGGRMVRVEPSTSGRKGQ
jgi:hypothetical protein